MKFAVVIAASALTLAGASNADAKSKFDDFDIEHLSFGTDPRMRAFKASLKAARAKDETETVATAATINVVDATAGVSTATSSDERRLRGVGRFAAASFWDAVSTDFSSVWTKTFGGFSSPPAEVSLDSSLDNSVDNFVDNSTLPLEPIFTDAPTLAPLASVTKKEVVKPVKRAQKFFETMFYGGENDCQIKHNTYFESHTWGLIACFESSLSTEDEKVYTASTYVKVYFSYLYYFNSPLKSSLVI